MGSPYMSELRIFGFDFAPKGWAACNGQLLPINQNQALFSLLGNRYGGDGVVNFALPDLRNRIPMHTGPGLGPTGVRGGEAAHTLTQNEMPSHNHLVQATNDPGTTFTATGMVFANPQLNAYSKTTPNPTTLMPQTVSNIGGSQPHENRSPYLTLNFCICLIGIFPTRN